MNKSLLALTIAASLALTGCGNDAKVDGKIQYEDYITDSLNADTKIVFDVLTDPILPTFLAMDSTDGTLSTEGKVGEEGYSTDLANPKTALGKADGWSVSLPIKLPFDDKIDEATIKSAFRLIKTTSLKAASPKVLGKLNEGTDYTIKYDSDSRKIVITPKGAFDPSSNYMFALTNQLKDADGEKVGMSSSYAMLKSSVKAPIEELGQAQDATHAIEKMVAAATGTDPKTIIYSSWFTTGSVGNVLSTTKAVIAQTIATVQDGGKPEQIWKGESKPNNLNLSSLYSMDLPAEGVDLDTMIDNDQMLTNLVKSDTDKDGSLAKAQIKAIHGKLPYRIKVYKGTVNLPYFLSDDTANEAWKKTPWESAVPSLAKISAVLHDSKHETYSAADQAAILGQLATLPEPITADDLKNAEGGNTVAQQKVLTALIGSTLVLADGSQLDAERLITQYSPLPKIKSIAKVPVLVFMPDTNAVPNPGAMIYQHGVTSVKETAYLFAANHMVMALQNGKNPSAVIAIDHPLHGERALADGTVTTPNTADVYMNLEYLNVARDNIRQSIIDDLGLRTSLTVMNGTQHPALNKINLANVSFFGHSLGAITGIGTYGLGNQSLDIEDPVKKAKANALFNFSSGAFANPGGKIPSLLLESASFGPTIKHSLLLGAKNDVYTSTCASSKAGGDCYSKFYGSLDPKSKSSIDATFETFAYAAQTVLDTVDPYNLASDVQGPLYVMKAEGDLVVPNTSTESLVSQLGLTDLTEYDSNVDTSVKHVARFNSTSEASHSSAIAPQKSDLSDLPTTQVIQTQVATFTADQGKSINILNPTLIQ